ncbi:hypothetical protein OH77DRAFT_210713 [Trametes cingulata]|nr:hypothetical protein OH77DRAFT_210713 [Trametes cingulata]
MDSARLPVEVCERIIDTCLGSWQSALYGPQPIPAQDSATLVACSLTCQAWLPRSRINLYHDVRLGTPDDLTLFVRTIREGAWLAELVRRVNVFPPPAAESDSKAKDTYLSFAQGFLVRHLRRLNVLLLGVDWSHYPPTYHSLVARLPIKELHLACRFRKVSSLFRLVWSFPDLRSLSLRCRKGRSQLPDADTIRHTCPTRRRHGVCRALKHLHICSRYTSLNSFPPPGAFGSAVADLSLVFGFRALMVGVSDNLLHCVSGFRELQTLALTLHYTPEAPHTSVGAGGRLIATLLNRISSPSHLASLDIEVILMHHQYAHGDVERDAEHFRRHTVVDLFTRELGGALQRFTALRRLRLLPVELGTAPAMSLAVHIAIRICRLYPYSHVSAEAWLRDM